jgi:hypothetical protein
MVARAHDHHGVIIPWRGFYPWQGDITGAVWKLELIGHLQDHNNKSRCHESFLDIVLSPIVTDRYDVQSRTKPRWRSG